MRIRSHLLKHQRPKKLGLTPSKSTTDRILASCVMVECRCEFRQGKFASHVDLKKAFISLHREHSGTFVRLCGIPSWIIGLLTGVLRDCEYCEVWRRRAQLLPCEYGSEAGMRAYSITFQQMHELDIRQTCRAKSLWSMCRQHRDNRSCFFPMMQ